MEHEVFWVLTALKVLTVAAGAWFLWVAVRAYRRHRTRSLGILIMAVGLMTAASVSEGAALQAFGLPLDQAHILEAVFMLAAFLVLLWSVLAPGRQRAVVQQDATALDDTQR